MGSVRACRAGFVGFGEVNSPRDLIEKKCAAASKAVEALGIELVKTAPVSDDPEGGDIRRAVKELKKAEFDFLILCIAGVDTFPRGDRRRVRVCPRSHAPLGTLRSLP